MLNDTIIVVLIISAVIWLCVTLARHSLNTKVEKARKAKALENQEK